MHGISLQFSKEAMHDVNSAAASTTASTSTSVSFPEFEEVAVVAEADATWNSDFLITCYNYLEKVLGMHSSRIMNSAKVTKNRRSSIREKKMALLVVPVKMLRIIFLQREGEIHGTRRNNDIAMFFFVLFFFFII